MLGSLMAYVLVSILINKNTLRNILSSIIYFDVSIIIIKIYLVNISLVPIQEGYETESCTTPTRMLIVRTLNDCREDECAGCS